MTGTGALSGRARSAAVALVRRPAVQRAARTFFHGVHRLEERIVLPPELATPEERKLRRSWTRHRPELLDQYLVSGYQNPRFNVQSILSRHALVRELFGNCFEDLMRDELRHAVELNETLRLRAAELGVTMGVYLDEERLAEVQRVTAAVADRERLFEERWRSTLAERTPSDTTLGRRLRVVELACGSANDFRALADYGIAPFLDYTGIDLNPANIANASRRFPDVRFQVGSVLNLPFEDRAVDVVLAFDIFEHLSLAAMEQALDEAMRVAERGLILSFFRMTARADHLAEPRGSYHWNELSAGRIEERLRSRYGDVTVVEVKRLLAESFGYRHTYNPKAWTMMARGRRSTA